MNSRHPHRLICALLLLPLIGLAEDNKTVVGPSNLPLTDGAHALQSGDAEEGIRLTQLGLSQASNERERQTARSNLCAGYIMLQQYERGLEYCNTVLAANSKYWRARSNRALIYIKLRRFEEADADLLVGEEQRPGSATIKAVRAMYIDATNPVAPSVIIDDRRAADIEDDDAE